MKHWLKFSELLSKRLSGELPGLDKQLLMAPNNRENEIRKGLHNPGAIKSSVLILIFPHDGLLKTVVMLRPSYNGVHSGQISLPGGKWEITDMDMAATVLRETQEEIGVDPSTISLVGALSPLYIPPSNYIVFPFIGLADSKPNFLTDSVEVQELIEINLEDLIDKNNSTLRKVSLNDGTSFEVPCYAFGEVIIWGATAMILSEFVELLQTIPLSGILASKK